MRADIPASKPKGFPPEKESKPMSEKEETMKERYTIEERYALIEHRLRKFSGDLYNDAADLLDDLMAEREKLEELVCKIDGYGFECEGGPLENCLEWIELRGIVNVSNK